VWETMTRDEYDAELDLLREEQRRLKEQMRCLLVAMAEQPLTPVEARRVLADLDAAFAAAARRRATTVRHH